MIVVRQTIPTPNPDMGEVFRYMGVKGEPNKGTINLANEAVEKIKSSAVCRVCYSRIPIERPEKNTIVIGKIRTDSACLEKNLKGCGEVYLFFATIGSAADRLIAASRITPSKALALDAAASAFTEAVCNKLNGQLKEEALKEGKFLRPRYSAGFGDFTLEYQKCFVDMLDTSKNIGVVLRNETMLFPTKSVSALIGISDVERKL